MVEWFRRDDMDTMDVNAEVLIKKRYLLLFLKSLKSIRMPKVATFNEDIWTPEIGERLDTQIEPNNPADKYAVWIRKSGKVMVHLKI